MTLDQESFLGRENLEVYRQMIAMRLPDIPTLAAIGFVLILALLPQVSLAKSDNDPPIFRTYNSQFIPSHQCPDWIEPRVSRRLGVRPGR